MRTSSSSKKKTCAWKKNAEKVRTSLGLPREKEGEAWCDKVAIAGMTQTPRVTNLVNTAVQAVMQKSEAKSVSGVDLMIDISQDVGRRPWTLDSVRSLTTSSELVSVLRRRQVLPSEHFRLLGFPPTPTISLAGNEKSSVQQDLAGEAMSPACIALVLAVALVTMQK